MDYKEIYNETISTDYGSIDNSFLPIGESEVIEVPEGIAHFLEHKLFEEKDRNIFESFSDIGAQVNAYTNFNQTSYLFYTTENFYEGLGLLIDFVQNPYLTDENVEKEKGIIAQEIMMYEDNANWRVYFNLLRAMYHNHPIRIDIAGTVESINTIDKEILYKTYNTFYNPTNMVLFVIGDLSFDEIIKIVNNSEKKFDKKANEIQRISPMEPEKIKEKKVEEKMSTSMPIFYMGFKDTDIGYKGRNLIKKDIITNIILDMLLGESTEYYNELYEEGLIDSSFGSFFTAKESYGHSLIVGQSNEPEVLYEKIVNRIKYPVDELLKEEDFIRIKKNELGNYVLGMNSIEFIANNFTDLYFSDFMITDYLELLKEITFKDIVNRFKEENLALSIIRPL